MSIELRRGREHLAHFAPPAMVIEAHNALTRSETVGELPDRVDLQLYQGDTFSMGLVVTEEDGPADLSDAEPRAQIRATHAGPIAAEFDAEVDGNIVKLYLSWQQTTELPTQGVWDCELRIGGTRVVTIVAGRVAVEPEVTR